MSELPPLSPLTVLDSPPLCPIELPSEVVPDGVTSTSKRKRTVLDCVDVPLLNFKVRHPTVAGAGDNVPPQIETTHPSTSTAHVLADPVPASRSSATVPKATSTAKSTTNNATAHHMSCTRCFGSAAKPVTIPGQDHASTRRILEAKKKLSNAQGHASKIPAPLRGISKVYAQNAARSTAASLSGHRSSAGKTSFGPSSVMQAVTENYSAAEEIDVGRSDSGKRPATISNGDSSPRTSPARAKHRSSRGSHVHTAKPSVATTTPVSPRPTAAADPAVQPDPGRPTTFPPRCSSDSSASTVDRSQATRSTNESLAPHLA
ncbi:hypothetical protein H0H87_005500, partial [Tephrocybe sp. NHM501043]